MRGLGLMVLAAALFALMASLVKTGSSGLGYHPLELVLWRSVGSIPPAVLLAHGRYGVKRWDWMISRCVFGFTAMLSWFTATRELGIGQLSVLVRLQPVFVGVLAPLLLGGQERAGLTVWLATGLGLGGSALLLSPALLAVDTVVLGYAALALFAALTSAVAHTSLRALGATEDPRTVVLWFQVAAAGFAAVLVGLLGVPLRVPPAEHLPVLLGIGVFAVGGQLALTAAYQADRAPKVAAASYAGPVFGFVIDVLVFGVLPTVWDGLGSGVVIAAGLLLLRTRGE